MAFDLSFFVILFGGVLVLLLVLGTWVLWKPLLALVPAPPDAVRRDLAYRIRGIGYPVEVVKDVLRVRVDSLAQVKLTSAEARVARRSDTRWTRPTSGGASCWSRP